MKKLLNYLSTHDTLIIAILLGVLLGSIITRNSKNQNIFLVRNRQGNYFEYFKNGNKALEEAHHLATTNFETFVVINTKTLNYFYFENYE